MDNDIAMDLFCYILLRQIIDIAVLPVNSLKLYT